MYLGLAVLPSQARGFVRSHYDVAVFDTGSILGHLEEALWKAAIEDVMVT